MVVGNISPQLSNTFVSRATGGHTPSRATGGRSGLTSNRGILPAGTVSILASLPGLRNNSSALLDTVRTLAERGGGSFKDVVSQLNGSNSGRSTSGRSSAAVSSSALSDPVVSPSQPETFDYLDAPWASAYKMSRETAYSEALNNTAYQRSVMDMMKAGLNPAVIFGAGNGYTAGSPAYVSSASSGSSRSGSSGSRYSGSRKSSDQLFSSSAYSIMSALGGIVGALATKSAGGYWIGTSLTQGAMSALSLLNKGMSKR